MQNWELIWFIHIPQAPSTKGIRVAIIGTGWGVNVSFAMFHT